MKIIKPSSTNHPDPDALRWSLDSVLSQYDRVANAIKTSLKNAATRHRIKAADQIDALDAELDRLVTAIELALQKSHLSQPNTIKSLKATCVKSGKRIRRIRHSMEFDAFPGFDGLIAELLTMSAAIEGLEAELGEWLSDLGKPVEKFGFSGSGERVSPYQAAA